MIRNSKLLVLDSAQLGAWAKEFDRGSLSIEKLEELALVHGWVIVLLWHHIEELLRHKNSALVDSRIRFIRSIPFVFWISVPDTAKGIGSVADLLRHELRSAKSGSGQSILKRAQETRSRLFRFGTGKEIPLPFGTDLDLLRLALLESEARSRETSSISQLETLEVPQVTLAQIARMQHQGPAAARKKFEELHSEIDGELSERGDERINDTNAATSAFLREVYESWPIAREGDDPLDSMLSSLNLTLADVDTSWTIAELSEHATFIHQIRSVVDSPDLAADKMHDLDIEQVPSSLIQRSFRRHRPRATRAKGSDLNDMYILSFAPYVDRIYIDKRTHDILQRAIKHEPVIGNLTGSVCKSADPLKILGELCGRSH